MLWKKVAGSLFSRYYMHWLLLLPEHSFPSPANPFRHWHVASFAPSETHCACLLHPTGPQSSSSADGKPIRLLTDLRGENGLQSWGLQNSSVLPIPSSGQVNLQIKTLRWLISYIYIKGSTSHMFPFTCSERIFSLKDLCGVQGSLCELTNNFLKAFANMKYKIAGSKWTQISSFTAYLRIPNHYDIWKGSIHPCPPKDSQTNK